MHPSETFGNDTHNSISNYNTIPHDKNILLKNKGQRLEGCQKPQTCAFIPEVIVENSKGHLGSLRKTLLNIECITMDILTTPIRVEESKGDDGIEETREAVPFKDLASAVIGDYFEDQLYEEEMKKTYTKCSKDNKNYIKTQAYTQAKEKYLLDELDFKKDMIKYGGII